MGLFHHYVIFLPPGARRSRTENHWIQVQTIAHAVHLATHLVPSRPDGTQIRLQAARTHLHLVGLLRIGVPYWG